MTDPESRRDPWKEAIECYEDLADEIVITGENWKYDFSWEEIGKFFQDGFDKATGDWVLRMDLDYFFMKIISKIRKFLNSNSKEPVVAFLSIKFFHQIDIKSKPSYV